jgi:hypothetical protein
MDIQRVSNKTSIYFTPEDKGTSDSLENVCKRSFNIIQSTWGLTEPSECRVYIMTSWLHFMFDTAPWYTRIYLAALFPFWWYRILKSWSYSGGWTIQYGKHIAVGIKPPRLLTGLDIRIGESIYIKEPDVLRKVEHITCHELTHAWSKHLHLPLWLNEGIAMVSVDRYMGYQTVKQESLDLMNRSSLALHGKSYADMNDMKKRDVAALYVRGYWITRFLIDTYPGLLQEILKKKRDYQDLEREIASAMGISRKKFLATIDEKVAAHYKSSRTEAV